MGRFGSPERLEFLEYRNIECKCGNTFSGKYCPECGEPKDKNKKKKYSYSKGYLVALIAFTIAFAFISNDKVLGTITAAIAFQFIIIAVSPILFLIKAIFRLKIKWLKPIATISAFTISYLLLMIMLTHSEEIIEYIIGLIRI